MAYETKQQRTYRLARAAIDGASERPAYCPMTGHMCKGRECAAALGREATLTDRLRTNCNLVAVWECTAYPANRRVDVAEAQLE